MVHLQIDRRWRVQQNYLARLVIRRYAVSTDELQGVSHAGAGTLYD
nr:hypothetical protein [Halomonas sp.]